MDREVFVYIDLEGKQHLVGKLWTRTRKGNDSASFEYDESWLENEERFSLEPALQLGPGPFHTGHDRLLFGAMGDSAPDRWGRILMRRAERRRADRDKQSARTLREIDYLLMVDDEARQGALRFAEREGGAFLAEPAPMKIPPLVELPHLLNAAERVLDESDSDEDLRLLLAPGSSLGGARPKASVRDRNGDLMIAKFPHNADEVNTVLWEALALTLASKAGIDVPEWRVEKIAKRPVLLLRRFDRAGALRIPFLSAMSMLNASDNETRSYLEVVDALRQFGASAQQDMHQLWRRIVFTVLISNCDDHLRNHGFLHAGRGGWRLSPAYDLNPLPVDIRPRVLSTSIDLDNTDASLTLALSVCKFFDLSESLAKSIAAEVAESVAGWRKEALKIGIDSAEIERMHSAFEHIDSKLAKGF